jgi:YidC/Oxa1 family membrane protein insertase
MQDQRNLFLAIALSLIVLVGYNYLQPRRPIPPPPQQLTQTAPVAPNAAPEPVPAIAAQPASDTVVDAPRIPIETPRLRGSLALAGGRIDDLSLTQYFETPAHEKQVTLLTPAGGANPFFVGIGWEAEGAVAAPNAQSIWSVSGDRKLTPSTPVTITWDNGAGLTFTRVFSVDENYLFTVTQTVTNHGTNPVALRPSGSIVRVNPPTVKASFGPAANLAGYYGSGLEEIDYPDLLKKGLVQHSLAGGWIGMNDKYWLVTMMPSKTRTAALTLRGVKSGGTDRYTAEYRAEPQTVAPGATIEDTTLIFAGAKEENLLAGYEQSAGITRLERSVDYGFFYLVAKPFFIALDYIFKMVGNFGVAILIFNVILKLILFPLQDRSFHQMARMKDLQPKIAALKERFGDDREKMAAAQMELFKKEKINPASGCLPLLVQIPIFLALYRVLSTSIEMRQAPFFGWIHDLSEADPTNIFTLFGTIPWDPPHFLTLGVWPLIYGGTMFLQQKMTPSPTVDPTQAKVMLAMPLIFMFFFATAPAGLTIYYSWNAVLTIAQMALIRRRADRRAAAASNGKKV